VSIEEVMRSRRSVRRFKPESPGRERVEHLIEVACTAPSASNKQPWRFFVVDDRSTIDRMADEVQAAVDRIVPHVEPQFMDSFRAYGDYFVRFSAAPVVVVPVFREIAVLSNLVDAGVGPDDLEQIRVMESVSGLASTSLAIQNLLLYAHATGLGASCMTGPLVAMRALKNVLGVPESWQIAAVVAVGFPDEDPATTPRKPVGAVLRWVGDERGR
jgi:nitroreductase